ncbi:MAG: DUF2240 family protein [Thermoplasmata archaeon]|jgi:hypothetical protein|nr:DUF2240 family protein [Thermoplasmata archaeon]
MADEATVCAAAFFRSVGKDVTTSDEFVMTVSLELKWMSPSDAKLLLRFLLESGILNRKGDFVRTSSDLSALDVPLAYRPSQQFLETVRSGKAPAKPTEPKKEADPDMFHVLMDVALKNGMQTKDFVPACSKIQKRLSIDIAAAALIVLRDNGIDIGPYVAEVYTNVSSA